MTTSVVTEHAHVFFDRAAQMWGVEHGEQDASGFIGPEQRWYSFNSAYDAAEAINRKRFGMIGGWSVVIGAPGWSAGRPR
ncbi:hypothetical protein ACEZDB_07000 [Streptacidiphilus sp. N1-3]|uniref:Uncharacterized protein n=1 Tax=Streptacidiphilus alkalitolerans TaxID=3342712 RepID=A0ABV6WWX8_9ACTN